MRRNRVARLWILAGMLWLTSLACLPATSAEKRFGDTADVTVSIDAGQHTSRVPPGVVGWGAMWKQKMVWPPPPAKMSDEAHRQYILHLGRANKPLMDAADVRNISWPWGVSFSTWAVNWENSAKPWSRRPKDCVRILNRTSPWCEKTLVGVGDLITLAGIWNLEAITVSVPLAVSDGRRPRWGPGLFNHAFDENTIEKVSNHARGLVDFMKSHPNWHRLKRVFLAAGCEWRHYTLKNPSSAVLTYAKLVRRIRQKIPESKVVVVACASDGTDIPGIKHKQAVSWNRYIYEKLAPIEGVAADLHRYRGMIGARRSGKSNRMAMTPDNLRVLLSTGLSQRGYLTVSPQQWNAEGPEMSTVLLENAIHGFDSDHQKQSLAQRPWPVSMAHADLVREALASPMLTFLGWTWFPESRPPEWAHGAISDRGVLQPHARAQAFISRYHRGSVVRSSWSDDSSLRGNCAKAEDGSLRLYGGNFSLRPRSLAVRLTGSSADYLDVQFMSATGVTSSQWYGRNSLKVPSLTLFRMIFR